MGKFRQFLTDLSSRPTSVISFPDDNLSKYQWIFTKLSMSIDIVEIWFGIANGQSSSIFDRLIFPPHVRIFIFDDNLSKYQWIFCYVMSIDTSGDLVWDCKWRN